MIFLPIKKWYSMILELMAPHINQKKQFNRGKNY
jgi:hypothetical protein